MMISSKGRYALRVMIDIAENYKGECIPLKEIAERQDISQKYLESIMAALSKGGLIDAVHGKHGGYRLNRALSDYSVAEILLLTEQSLAPVACLEGCENTCERSVFCKTLPVWEKLNSIITDYLKSVSLADLISANPEDNYVI